MKWFITNNLKPVARLYWSDKAGSWGAKSQATAYARKYANKEMPLCFLGAQWLKEPRS
jgi:hypothetical protein